MHTTRLIRISGCSVAIKALCGALPLSAASFIGLLDGASTASTFETGSQVPLPSLGWVSISGGSQIFDAASGNGALVGATPYDNYTVQFDTGTPILPDNIYTFTLQMGYLAGLTGGESGYSFQLGTVIGSNFTGLGSPVTGTVAYTGSMTAGVLSAPVSQVFSTGGSVSGDNLAVRWSQTSSLGGVTSDFFGIDNVTLSVSAVPEPSDYVLVTGVALLGFVAWRRRHAR
jgi:hypothetical protein